MEPVRPQRRFDYDLYLLFSTLALVVIGILFIYSSGITSDGLLVSNEPVKQVIWALVGIVLMVGMSIIDYSRLKEYSVYIYLFFILVLVYTRIFGRVVNGARSWIGIGEAGIQPSEFAKLATILFLSQFLSNNSRTMSDLAKLAVSCAIVGLPMLLVLSQPDFGTAIVFLPILLFVTFVSGIKRSYVVFLLSAIMGTFVLTVLPYWQKLILKKPLPVLSLLIEPKYSLFTLLVLLLIFGIALMGYLSTKKKLYYWITYGTLLFSVCAIFSLAARKLLKEYQIMRLIVFMDPGVDPRGSGWNIIQSMTAIGSGGFFGRGFLQGTQSHYRFLPKQSTDFIFSIISEELGFVGCVVIFSLFMVILFRCLYLVKNVTDQFGALIASGIASMIFFHFMINIGMTMSVMPITGIPLFFLSYGGSSLLLIMMGVGILLSIYQRRFKL